MSTTIQLPRHIQSIIDEAVPSALKLHSALKNKENSFLVISNHISSNTLPKNLQLQIDLVIPNCVLEDEKYSGFAIDIPRQRFRDSLQSFQREALVQMRTIAEYSVDAQKRLLLHFMKKVDSDIITFHTRFLQKLDSAKANNFKIIMDSYPFPETEDHNNELERNKEVQEVLEFIKAWRSVYEDSLRTKLETEVATEINREKKVNSKDAAEDLLVGKGNMYSNIDSVQELIRHELKPIKDTIQRFEIEMSKFRVFSQQQILEQAEETNNGNKNKRRKLNGKPADLPSNSARSQKDLVQGSGVE